MAKPRLADARAQREKNSAAAAVAAAVSKPTPATPSSEVIRTNVVISKELTFRVEERMLQLKREGSPTSWSGLVEVALSEILERTDLAEVVSRYGLGLRRK